MKISTISHDITVELVTLVESLLNVGGLNEEQISLLLANKQFLRGPIKQLIAGLKDMAVFIENLQCLHFDPLWLLGADNLLEGYERYARLSRHDMLKFRELLDVQRCQPVIFRLNKYVNQERLSDVYDYYNLTPNPYVHLLFFVNDKTIYEHLDLATCWTENGELRYLISSDGSVKCGNNFNDFGGSFSFFALQKN